MSVGRKNPESAYDALTPKQQKFFRIYIENRTFSAMAREHGGDQRAVRNIFNSPRFKAALKEHNDSLRDALLYDEAVIIDKLWYEYHDEDTPKNVKINILVLLGKHIGMWAAGKGEAAAKSNYTYNIVNYNEVKEEISKNKEEVEKVKDEPIDVPEGVHITQYPETVQ